MNLQVDGMIVSTAGDGVFKPQWSFYEPAESLANQFEGKRITRSATWRNASHVETDDGELVPVIPAHEWDYVLQEGSGNKYSSSRGGVTLLQVETDDGIAFGVALCSTKENFDAAVGRGWALRNACYALKRGLPYALPHYKNYEFPQEVWKTIVEWIEDLPE